MTKKINIEAIRIDGGTQSRVELNDDALSDYVDAVKAGAQLPPVTVFFDGVDHWLADGFHRFHAHRQAGKASIAADVRDGARREAVLYSLGANGTHGLRRTNADKRKAVRTMLDDAEWSQWSDRKIADACGVSHTFVALMRKADEVAAVIVEESAEVVPHAGPTAPKVATVATPATPVATPKVATVATPQPTQRSEASADDAFDGFDPIAELESTQKLLEAAEKRIDALTADDIAAELDKQIGIRQGIEARLSLEMAKVGELQKELDGYGRWFAELRKASGLEKRSEITRLVRDAANNRSEAL